MSTNMEAGSASALRARWKDWVGHIFASASEVQVEQITDAVIRAVAAGADREEAVEQAHAAWERLNGAPQGAEAVQARAMPPLLTRTSAQPPNRQAPLAAAAPLARTPKSAGAAGITGRVAGFQSRNELVGSHYLNVWDFHVERPEGPPSPSKCAATRSRAPSTTATWSV